MIEVANVSYSYLGKGQRVDALKNITCAFEAGKVYTLYGPSGSGKSTLLSLLAALDAPTQGQILWDGQDIAALSPDEYRRKQVSIIFQAYNLLPFSTALENVAYAAILQGKDKKQARQQAGQQLCQLGLDESYFARMPHQLSGGEQQRVAIARALCAHSKAILADEPTGNLDSENGAKIMDILLNAAHQENCLVVMATHDPDMVARADESLRLKDGRLEKAE